MLTSLSECWNCGGNVYHFDENDTSDNTSYPSRDDHMRSPKNAPKLCWTCTVKLGYGFVFAVLQKVYNEKGEKASHETFKYMMKLLHGPNGVDRAARYIKDIDRNGDFSRQRKREKRP